MNPQLEELACLYVLDRLDARERAAFEARLLHDPDLAELVSGLESTLSRLVHALPQRQPPAGLPDRLEGLIDRLPKGDKPERAATPLWASIARWGIAAVIALGVGTIAVQSLRRTSSSATRPFVIVVGLDSRRTTPVELPLGESPQNSDARFIQLASMAERFWEKPDDLPVKLGSNGESGRAYALFDPGSNQGFIAIRQLPIVDQGKRYHLWILDTASGGVREAGVLPVTGTSPGLFFFSVQPTAGVSPDRLDFFVTAEDPSAPGPSRPHGKVVLGDRSF